MAVPAWAKDPLAGAIGADAARVLRGATGFVGRGLSDFLGSEAVKQSPYAGLSGIFQGRPAAAGERQGPYVPDRIKNAPAPTQLSYLGATPVPPGRGVTPIIQADDETYKQLMSQFGGQAGVTSLASQPSAPLTFDVGGKTTKPSLSQYYAAQQEVGEKGIDEIVSGLGYAKGSPLDQWARSNQALALREYNKKFPQGSPTTGPSDEAIKSAMAAGQFFPAAGSPSPIQQPPQQPVFGVPANPVVPTEQRDEAGRTQGDRVSEARGGGPGSQLQQAQIAKTATQDGMPGFETTLDRVGKFLGNQLGAAGTAYFSNLLGPKY